MRVELFTRGGTRNAFQLIPDLASSFAVRLSPLPEIHPRQPTGANMVFKVDVFSEMLDERLIGLEGKERVPASQVLRIDAAELSHD